MDETSAPRDNFVGRASGLLMTIILAATFSLAFAAVASLKYPTIIGHAMLAFVLGLRHAVDVDHLAAIDNVTRQLVKRGQSPVSVGFWFAVGHSSVVIILSICLALGYRLVLKHMQEGSTGSELLGLAASFLSVLLLATIGLLNARVAMGLLASWRSLRRRSLVEQEEILEAEGEGSLRTAIASLPLLQRTFDRMDRPEKMTAVGLLFGLGFDTATQVGVIGLSAISSSHDRIPSSMVLIFPVCFSCSMCLVDTLNGVLVLAAYRWATVRPTKKIFYNFIVTALSACIALVIGGLETLQIVGKEFGLHGSFWVGLQHVDMGHLGFLLVLTFALIFGLSMLWWEFSAKNARGPQDGPLLESM